MRFDKIIYLVREKQKKYDPKTGNYEKVEPTKVPKMASVVDTTEKTMMLVYGELRQKSYTITLQIKNNEPISYIEMDDVKYAIDHVRMPKLGQRQIFVVSEVQ